MFFENLGPVKFYTDTWNLVIHYNFSQTLEKFLLINEIQNATKNMCSLIPFHLEKTICLQSLQLINNKLPQLENKYKSFTQLIGHRRQKRGIVNGVGTVLKTLFGSMDDADAEYYNNAINHVITDNKHFTKLLGEQTQVVQDTIISFNKTINELNVWKQKLNENIIIFNNFSESIENLTDAIKLSNLVNEHNTLLIQSV